MVIISPSVLACDFSKLGQEAVKAKNGGAEYLHLDVMDGHFVPNISFGAGIISSIRSLTDAVFDVHLMISEPLRYLKDFVAAGADIITFHIECDDNADEVIDRIISLGCKPCISLKPATPAEAVFPYLDRLSMVLVMTVEPGFGGQSYMEDMEDKISAIRAEISRRGLDVDIEVDGGINSVTAQRAASAGANVLVAGSAVFKAENSADAISAIRSAAENI